MTSTRHHNVYIDNAACFWTSSVVNFIPVLADAAVADCLLALWDKYRKAYGVKLLGYVIMPNHFHIAVWSEKAEDVQRFLRRILIVSSLEIGGMVKLKADAGDALAGTWLRAFQSHAGSGSGLAIWKERGRAFPVTSGDTMRQKLDYMHGNPVRMGLVSAPDDWRLSSASWYAGGSGPISIDVVPGW
jgi:putative transposase